MWILVNCKDPIHGPGHNEERRIIFLEDEPLDTPVIASPFNGTPYQTTGLIVSPFNGISLLTEGMEVHPHTTGEAGYHCPICHKDITPSKLQGRGSGKIIIDDDISNLPEPIPKKKKKKTSDYTACETYEPCSTPKPPSTQDEETIKQAICELRKEFEYMAIRKMFIMKRNKIGEYISPGTFCLWAGYWECAIKLGIIQDKIEYVNEG